MEISKNVLNLLIVLNYITDIKIDKSEEMDIRDSASFDCDGNPNKRGNRDVSMLLAYANKVSNDIFRSMSEKDVSAYCKLLENNELIIRPRSVALSQESTVVSYEDLQRLINSSMESNCAICMKNDQEIKNCPLRRTLNHVAVPDIKYHFGNPCPHINRVITKKRGEYIDDV